MAGITQAKVGDAIPITLQISDGATNQYPQAEIRDNDNNLLNTLNLTHVASGMYGAVYSMPDEVFIACTYIVYTDAGHTTESTDYGRDIDTFVKIAPGDYKATGFSTHNPEDVDIQLSSRHGVGSWETGAGGSDWGATEREQIRDALGVDGDKTKSVGGVMQNLKKLLEAIHAFVS